MIGAGATTGCAGPLSALDPAGPAAGAVSALWWAMFWGAAAVFLIMLVLAAWAWLRPADVAGIAPRHWIVHGGLIFPSVGILVLLVYAFFIGERLLARGLDEPPLRIEVHAVQWNWEFSYPEAPGAAATRNVLHLPAGEPVDIVVTSGDVIHSFWIPRLGGKIDAIPGHENVVRLQADRPGTYGGVCAEFCGEGHTVMRFSVEAHARDDYEAVLAAGEGAQ